MNYIKHYNLLIERAKNRKLVCYVERHHIIPKCMNGGDTKDNLVELTPEEHYVAHQLLVQIHPDETGLVWAAIRMAEHSTNNRKNNKVYGWLKRKYQIIAKQRTGSKNGSFGKPWYYNSETGAAKKFLEGKQPSNWIKGRTPKNETLCEECQELTGSYIAKFCSVHRTEQRKKNGISSGKKFRNRKTEEDKDLFTFAITTSKTWIDAIKKAGFKTDGYSRTRLQRFAEENRLKLLAD